MRKILFTILILGILLVFSFYFRNLNQLEAGSSDNVSGWAWSENIGWISFNCTNNDSCSTVDYGVTINETNGKFSGYAWSSNIGWIDFGPAGPYPASPEHEAKLNNATNEITGWARIVAGETADAWDGWIKMAGDNYGVSIDPGTGEFQGWAWSEDFGWISFNCSNPESGDVCGVSNYKVETALAFQQPPNPPSNLSETFYSCAWGMTPQVALGFSIILNWEYSDPNEDPQLAYEVWLDDNPGFTGSKFNYQATSSSASYSLDLLHDEEGDWFSALSWATTYYWKVRVKDEGSEQWSEFSPIQSFTTPLHASPNPDFSWSPQNPSVGELVQFSDQTTFYDGAAAWNWDLGDGTATTTQNPEHSYSEINTYTVILQATDGDGFSCSVDKQVSVSVPLPKWKEIAP